jgi:hypothetical protein
MSEKPADYGREVRDTVVKSSLTGVAATVLAVTVFSPAGFGGIIGTSLASGVGASTADADDPYANLPAFPAPLSQAELQNIHSQLARSTASLEITRAATEERIEHIRSIALSDGVGQAAPAQAAEASGLRLAMSEPEAFVPAAAPAPAQLDVTFTPVSYTANDAAPRDANLELAELLLRDTF